MQSFITFLTVIDPTEALETSLSYLKTSHNLFEKQLKLLSFKEQKVSVKALISCNSPSRSLYRDRLKMLSNTVRGIFTLRGLGICLKSK
jgi:hypothetical protein